MNKAGYEALVEHLNQLLDAGGANQAHLLAGLVEALGELIQTYEKRQTPMAEAEPSELLRYLMTEQGLKQSDLAGIASQETISDILCGRRGISKAQVRATPIVRPLNLSDRGSNLGLTD